MAKWSFSQREIKLKKSTYIYIYFFIRVQIILRIKRQNFEITYLRYC